MRVGSKTYDSDLFHIESLYSGNFLFLCFNEWKAQKFWNFIMKQTPGHSYEGQCSSQYFKQLKLNFFILP